MNEKYQHLNDSLLTHPSNVTMMVFIHANTIVQQNYSLLRFLQTHKTHNFTLVWEARWTIRLKLYVAAHNLNSAHERYYVCKMACLMSVTFIARSPAEARQTNTSQQDCCEFISIHHRINCCCCMLSDCFIGSSGSMSRWAQEHEEPVTGKRARKPERFDDGDESSIHHCCIC